MNWWPEIVMGQLQASVMGMGPPPVITLLIILLNPVSRWCAEINFDDMKLCDAPESNNARAGCENT
ncbi:Uncharacterized protein M6B38_219590 [Iris pallida]|uniref:Uncharacterized protein n=1 Tax=Iris pallida TaxID=29817 RepID=A0AAX6DY24_IRIPA|nr:Uncharacterized protein M6B38_219590 [Iris pallida]